MTANPPFCPLSSALNPRDLIPPFELPAVNRSGAVQSWQYKQRKHLVIFFFPGLSCPACCQLLLDFARQYSRYQSVETEILAISSGSLERLQDWLAQAPVPFPVLHDGEGRVLRRYIGPVEEPLPVGLFVCDRFGELYTQTIAADANDLPSEPEIRDWAGFIDMRCPECFPPEW
ncbi:redoxin domain-containing protein [Pseudanabaena sp. FACHB-2040]|uniref:redoxin domain-containing protein n=1 Tax=Pseudanabaena sp. FACHB-2040 TaxID=2692859 RepID=UPI001685E723|nr:redoxin domain-containing protein [Pseudanabaena sp. FACHB-2040]MBD2260014.1 peroxiredoxin family protein [Pseudanabaena sp. FACHB-2040]